MAHYISYYNEQIGGGKSGVRSVFSGARYQRGSGVGSWLGGIFRGILPYLKSGAKAVGKEAIRAGLNVFDDVANNGATLKDSLKERARESGKNLKRKAAEKIDNIMKGSGYKSRSAKRKRQSRKTRVSVRTARKKIKKRTVTSKRRKVTSKKKKNKLRNIADIFGPK